MKMPSVLNPSCVYQSFFFQTRDASFGLAEAVALGLPHGLGVRGARRGFCCSGSCVRSRARVACEESVEGCGELASDVVFILDVEGLEERLIEQFADMVWG